MVQLGVDSSKYFHTIVAVNALGVVVGSKTVETTRDGMAEMLTWALQFDDRCWAIEDVRNLSRPVERALLDAGETGVRVAPKYTPKARRKSGMIGKSDLLDAQAVAQVALRERTLPPIDREHQEHDIQLISSWRDDLVEQRTAAINRAKALLHEIDPFREASLDIDSQKGLMHAIACISALGGIVYQAALYQLNEIVRLNVEIKTLETQLDELVTPIAPHLLAIPGVGLVTAAAIIAEVGVISRFPNSDKFAAFCGTAPIPVWSSNTQRVRLNRSGNRAMNAGLYRIAITQMRYHPEARAYIDRKLAEGKTKKEARRCLMRKISNRVYKAMVADVADWSFLEHLADAA